MKTAHKRPGLTTAIAALCFATACTQVLGIGEARIDPGLIPTGSGGTSMGAAGSNVGGLGGGGGTSIFDASTDNSGGTPGHDANVSDGSADGDASPICKEYCTNIMDYCKDDLKQYVDIPQCLKVCSYFQEGAVGEADGNTASCRLKYAGKARYAAGTERDAYCRKSGPGSEGTCGAICDGFCALMMGACTPKFAPYNFPSADACLAACRILRDAPPYTVNDGALPDRNDAQCRLFHVCSSVMDPDEHCEHAMGVTMCEGKDGSSP